MDRVTLALTRILKLLQRSWALFEDFIIWYENTAITLVSYEYLVSRINFFQNLK